MMANLAVLVEQMQVALDAIAEAVVFCNADNQVQWCNEAFEQLVNLPNSSIIGHNLTKVLPLRTAGKKVSKALYPSIKVLRGEYEITEYEWQWEQRDQLRLQISGSCVVAGEESTCVLTIRNVTEATENQRTAAALQASETKFRAIVENANDIFVLIDPATGKLCYISPKVSDLLGYTPAEMEGQSFEPFVHPDDLSKCHEAFQRVITTGEKQLGVEHRVRHKNGSWRWHLLNASTLRDDEGNLLILGTGWDITDRKLAEAALRESEFKFRSIVENANDLLFIVKPNGIVSYLSPNVFNVMGYEPDEMIGKYLPALHPDDEQKCLDAFNQVLITGEKYSGLEYRIRYKDGTWAWHISNFGASEDTNGEKVITGVARDISDRKQAEEALKASEAKLNLILSSARGVVSHYRNYVVRGWETEYHSPGSIAVWGYTPEELMADNYLFASRIHPDDLQEIYRNAYDCIYEERNYESEYRYFHPDGSLRWISLTLSSIRDEENNCWRTTGISIDITDKKRAEAALIASETRLNTILDSTQAAIYRIRLYADGEWEFEYCSPGCLNLWGYAPEALMADKNLFVSHMMPEDFATMYQESIEAVLTETTYECEYRYHHPDGSWRWFASSLSPERDEAANSWICTCISTDITARKQAEEALRLSEARIRALYESIGFAIILGSPNGILDCNSAAEQLFRSSREEMVGKHVSVFSSPLQPNGENSYTLANQMIAIAIKKGNHRFEWIHRRADGVDFPAEVCLTAVEVGANKFVQAIVQDLSDRKQAEAALAQRASLAAFRADVGSALGMSDSLLMMLNRCIKAAVKHLNISCARIWMLNPAENIFELQANAGCDTRGNGTSDRINFNQFSAQVGKNNAILKNKSIVNPNWVRRENIIAAASYPLTLEAETLGMLAIFSHSELNESTLEALEFAVREIALGIKRKQTEAALKVAKETAENASKAKSIFLANMSHELRTPLNAILGFSQLMERDPVATSRQRESLGIINRSGEHLLALIDDVLEMSKIEAGRIVLNPVAFNLHLLLNTLQEMFQIRTQSKQLFLEFDIAADLPQFVVTDEGKLRQVLINLLGNAVKFTKNGGITLRASVNSSELSINPQLFFAIQDTGKGIASEEMERLFQPFVQTESGIQSKEGTGLGLTISRQYVQLMGGNIDCHSVLGQGSVFSFNLPVKLAQSGEMIAQPTTKGRVIQIAPNQPSYRILIVDDRQENCELLLQLLQPVGFEMKTAANGEEAIAIWQQWHPHLIFMDMRMPLMDGYEATRQIKAMQVSRGGAPVPAPGVSRGGAPVPAPGASKADSFPQTAIVALTASAFEEQQANVIAAGCDDFVRKPFREQVIFEKIAQYLKVEYIYEEPPAQNSTSPVNNQITQLSYIEQMPSAWIAQLYQAAIAVDASQILQLIAEIPPERGNLAQELNSLLQNFCFDEILEMIEMDNG